MRRISMSSPVWSLRRDGGAVALRKHVDDLGPEVRCGANRTPTGLHGFGPAGLERVAVKVGGEDLVHRGEVERIEGGMHAPREVPARLLGRHRTIRGSKQRAGQRLESAEGAGHGDVIAVVAGFDDLPLADPDHEDARDGEVPAAGRARVSELHDDDLRVVGGMDDCADRLEALRPPGLRASPREVFAQLRATTERPIAQRRERVSDIGPVRVELRQLVELGVTLRRREPSSDEAADAGGDCAHNVGRGDGGRRRHHQPP